MKFQCKGIKVYRSISEETLAMSCSIYINGKKCGWAKNGGYGAETEIRIDKLQDIADEYAFKWLNVLEPNPVDYSQPGQVHNGKVDYPRIPAHERKKSTTHAYLVSLVDIMVSNSEVIKDMKKIKSKVSCLTTDCGKGEYVSYRMKPSELTDEFQSKIESKPDFVKCLYPLPVEDIALKLGNRSEHSGPLVLEISV